MSPLAREQAAASISSFYFTLGRNQPMQNDDNQHQQMRKNTQEKSETLYILAYLIR